MKGSGSGEQQWAELLTSCAASVKILRSRVRPNVCRESRCERWGLAYSFPLLRSGDPGRTFGIAWCTYLLQISLLAVPRQHTHTHTLSHTHTHTVGFTPQSCDKEKNGGGRLIKTLRAVLGLTGWVKHTQHRSIVTSTHTHTHTTHTHTHWCLYSFRLSHSHTPTRSHFLCQPAKLQLSFFLSMSRVPSFCLWETGGGKVTCLARCLAASPGFRHSNPVVWRRSTRTRRAPLMP